MLRRVGLNSKSRGLMKEKIIAGSHDYPEDYVRGERESTAGMILMHVPVRFLLWFVV